MLIRFAVVFLLTSTHAFDDDLPGFAREDFGKVVLSKSQFAGSVLEASYGNYTTNRLPITIPAPYSDALAERLAVWISSPTCAYIHVPAFWSQINILSPTITVYPV